MSLSALRDFKIMLNDTDSFISLQTDWQKIRVTTSVYRHISNKRECRHRFVLRDREMATAGVVYELCGGKFHDKPPIAGSKNATIAKKMRFAVAITIAVYVVSK